MVRRDEDGTAFVDNDGPAWLVDVVYCVCLCLFDVRDCVVRVGTTANEITPMY